MKRARKKRRDVLLRRWQASAYLEEEHGLRRAPATLAKDACGNTGPPFRYINRIPFYWPAGLDNWVKTARSRPRLRAKKYDQPRNRRPAGAESAPEPA
jgi:hypothetical protein